MTTDSPEAIAAKAEGWAEKRAQHRPMVKAARALGGFDLAKETARKYWKLVIRNMKRDGKSKEEIEAANGRAKKFIALVEVFHKSILDVRNDKSIPRYEKQQLLLEMLSQQDEERRKLVGE